MGSPTGCTAGAGVFTALAHASGAAAAQVVNWSWGCRGSHWWGKHGIWRRRNPQRNGGHYGGWGKVQLLGIWDRVHRMTQSCEVRQGHLISGVLCY